MLPSQLLFDTVPGVLDRQHRIEQLACVHNAIECPSAAVSHVRPELGRIDKRSLSSPLLPCRPHSSSQGATALETQVAGVEREANNPQSPAHRRSKSLAIRRPNISAR